MTSDEKIQKTLKFLLDNNVDSFIYPDGLKKYWGEIGLSENEQLSLVTHLYNDDYIEVFPRDSISKGHFPGQLKISFKGIKFIDDTKLLPAVDRTILGLERKHFKRVVLFAIIAFIAGIITPILTDATKKVLGVSESEKETIIKLQIQDNRGNNITDTTIHINSLSSTDTLTNKKDK